MDRQHPLPLRFSFAAVISLWICLDAHAQTFDPPENQWLAGLDFGVRHYASYDPDCTRPKITTVALFGLPAREQLDAMYADLESLQAMCDSRNGVHTFDVEYRVLDIAVARFSVDTGRRKDTNDLVFDVYDFRKLDDAEGLEEFAFRRDMDLEAALPLPVPTGLKGDALQDYMFAAATDWRLPYRGIIYDISNAYRPGPPARVGRLSVLDVGMFEDLVGSEYPAALHYLARRPFFSGLSFAQLDNGGRMTFIDNIAKLHDAKYLIAKLYVEGYRRGGIDIIETARENSANIVYEDVAPTRFAVKSAINREIRTSGCAQFSLLLSKAGVDNSQLQNLASAGMTYNPENGEGCVFQSPGLRGELWAESYTVDGCSGEDQVYDCQVRPNLSCLIDGPLSNNAPTGMTPELKAMCRALISLGSSSRSTWEFSRNPDTGAWSAAFIRSE